MIINLKSAAKSAEQFEVKLELNERLPAHFNGPCLANCQFDVKVFDKYYLLSLKVDTELTLTCQRCLHDFNHHYVNQTSLAICFYEEIAEQMMEQYECIVCNKNEVELKELVTDELHLYVPEFHPQIDDCADEINQFMTIEAD